MAEKNKETLSSIATIVGNIDEVVSGIKEQVEEIPRLSAAIQELAQSMKALQQSFVCGQPSSLDAAVRNGPPRMGGSRSAIQSEDPSPLDLQITTRPFKKAGGNTTKEGITKPEVPVINGPAVMGAIVSLIQFEKKYEGAAEATIKLLCDIVRGLPQGILPADEDNTHIHSHALHFFAGIRDAVGRYVREMEHPDPTVVVKSGKALQTIIGTRFDDLQGGIMGANFRRLLGYLFQSYDAASSPSTPYALGAAPKGKVGKLFLSKSLLGAAWAQRLPAATAKNLGFLQPASSVVPPIQFNIEESPLDVARIIQEWNRGTPGSLPTAPTAPTAPSPAKKAPVTPASKGGRKSATSTPSRTPVAAAPPSRKKEPIPPAPKEEEGEEEEEEDGYDDGDALHDE